MKNLFTLCCIGIVASGCSSLKPRDFADSKKSFAPDEYFTGHTRSWGVIENRKGEPKSRFTSEAFGKRDANGDLIIDQSFHFDGGRKLERTWQVHRLDAHHFEATANDVVGKAKGEARGNAFQWDYTIVMKAGKPMSKMHFHQWMYLPDETETMFTRVSVRKFGIKVGQITESFRRVP